MTDGIWIAQPALPNSFSYFYEDKRNWSSNPTVPDGTAYFGSGAFYTTVVVTASHTVGAWNVGAGATYTIVISSGGTVTFNGAGLTTVGSLFVVPGGNMVLKNSATLDHASIDNTSSAALVSMFDHSTAGHATIGSASSKLSVLFDGNSTAGSAALIQVAAVNFQDHASAGHATIVAGAGKTMTFSGFATGSTGILSSNGQVSFKDNSTLAAASLSTDGKVDFTQSASAGTGTIDNYGTITFHDSSSAANATINSVKVNNVTNLIGFLDHASAGSATIVNAGGTYFMQNATAGNATITNNGGMTFYDASTTGTAHIINNGGITFYTGDIGASQISGDGSILFISGNAGSSYFLGNAAVIDFDGDSTAGNAILQGGSAKITFHETSTSGAASISQYDGKVTYQDNSRADTAHIYVGSRGIVEFSDNSSADHSTMQGHSNGDGVVYFQHNATAGNGKFIDTTVLFFDRSDAGMAVISLGDGNIVNFAGTGKGNDHRYSLSGLNGSGQVYLKGNELSIGNGGISSSYAGIINEDGGFVGSLVKIGAGTTALKGANTYTGGTTVQQGTLEIDGSVATGAVVNGGTLSGRGTVVGGVTVNAGGTLNPGASFGALTTGGLSMAAGAALRIDILGASVLAPYDQVAVRGTVALGGATLRTALVGGYDPGSLARTVFTLIDNDGTDAVSGRFAGLDEGSYFAIGTRLFSITYRGGTGNDVVITSDGVVIEGTAGKDTIDLSHAPAGQPFATALNDLIHGNGGKDQLSGAAGDDTIIGGEGKDRIDGGQGSHDLADYADKGSEVNVHLNGSHAVKVSVHGKTEDSIKNIEDVRGGTARDTLTGDKKANHLFGGGENDVLNGGAGKDMLTGDAGRDHFVFDSKLGSKNIDIITDFTHGTDKIQLGHSIFAAVGKLDADDFHQNVSGNAATNGKQHVIYDAADGTLWYDADGKKHAHAAVEFAVLGTDSHPASLDWHDFAVV